MREKQADRDEGALPTELPEEIESWLSHAAWWLLKAELLMRSDRSFASTIPARLREVAQEANMDAVVTPSEDQRERLEEIHDALYTAANWLEEAADQTPVEAT